MFLQQFILEPEKLDDGNNSFIVDELMKEGQAFPDHMGNIF